MEGTVEVSAVVCRVVGEAEELLPSRSLNFHLAERDQRLSPEEVPLEEVVA